MPETEMDLGDGVDIEVGNHEIEINDIGGFVILTFEQWDKAVALVAANRKE
jgi:hypothetical protein